METSRWNERQGRVVVVAVLSLLVVLKPAMGETVPADNWKAWQTKGDLLMEESEVGDACESFRRALAEALHSDIRPEDLLRIHTSLASAYALNGRFADAEMEFRRTLALEQKAHGTESFEYAMDFAGLLLLPTYRGDREQGIQLLKQVISNREVRTMNISELLTAKDYLAKLLFNDGRLSEAETMLLEAQSNDLKNLRADPWVEAELLNDLGVIRDREGRYEEAAALDEQTITLIEKRFGPQSSALVAPLNNLGTMFARLGQLETAEKVFQKAATLCVMTLGIHHPTYGQLLMNQAAVLKRLGRKKESKLLMAQSERIVEESNRRSGVGATVSLAELRAKR